MDDKEFNSSTSGQSDAADRGLIGDLEYRRDAKQYASNDLEGEGRAAISELSERVSKGVDDFADKASDRITDLNEAATTAYENAAWRVQRARDAVEPFVQDRPYAALGIAAAVGVVVGLLMAGRNTRVIYVRQAH